jgi:hypothetical protein
MTDRTIITTTITEDGTRYTTVRFTQLRADDVGTEVAHSGRFLPKLGGARCASRPRLSIPVSELAERVQDAATTGTFRPPVSRRGTPVCNRFHAPIEARSGTVHTETIKGYMK